MKNNIIYFRAYLVVDTTNSLYLVVEFSFRFSLYVLAEIVPRVLIVLGRVVYELKVTVKVFLLFFLLFPRLKLRMKKISNNMNQSQSTSSTTTTKGKIDLFRVREQR